MSDYALQITETVARLQKELKCGICCSTYKDPVLSTCFHIFCRACLNACFERKRKVQCPICRTILDKRSCRDSYQLTMAVQNYLKLSEAFKKDIADQEMFATLPPEKVFMESQMPLDITIIPENDGKRCAPDFAIPLLPVRRKRVSKPAPPEPQVDPFEPPPPAFAAPISAPIEPVKIAEPKPAPKPVQHDADTTTDPYKISVEELRGFDISERINTLRENSPDTDEIDALFQLIPSMKPLLEKNMKSLMLKMGIFLESPKRAEKRVSFARMPSPEHKEEPEQLDEEHAEPYVLKENNEPVMAPDVVFDENGDEVVMDSLEETEVVAEVPEMAEMDRTMRAVQTEMERVDEELARVPKTIVCSRIHNDEDEVELLSDFYNKFLSNACRFGQEVGAHTTHVVMMNSEGRMIPQKSTSYVQAVARKCIVVSRQWLVDCLKSGLLLSEAEYTITSCSSEPTLSREIGWLRARNDENGRLFEGCRFMILRKFSMGPSFDYKQLIELVKLCGGEILSNYDDLSPEKLYIVFSKQSKSLDAALEMEHKYRCSVVTIEWVLDSISDYSILPTDNYRAVDWTEHV